MYHFSIDFEYYEGKSKRNLEKHGISFEEAKELWAVPGIERQVTDEPEMRWLRIAMRAGKCYTCVFTVREGRVRIISARRSRDEELKLYHARMSDEKET